MNLGVKKLATTGGQKFLGWVLKHKAIITIFSEAIAAVGILAAGASFTYDSWSGRHISVSGAVISSTPSHISLLITNNGGVDIAIKRVNLVSDVNIKNQVKVNGGGLLLEKGKSLILPSSPSRLNSTVQYVEPEVEERLVTRTLRTPCQAVVEFVVAGEENKTASIDFVCYAATIISAEVLESLLEEPAPAARRVAD
jgi:hypothetical protein